MKLKRLISTLVVFTLVMACAVSVSADAATISSVTSVYDLEGKLNVKATVTGTDGDMISYVLHTGDTITDSSIKYIDQATITDGTATFEVTDTVANLGATKVKFGTSGAGFTNEITDTVDELTNDNVYLIMDYDPIFGDVEIGGNEANEMPGVTILFTVSDALIGKLYVDIDVDLKSNGTGTDIELTEMAVLSSGSNRNLGLQIYGDATTAQFFSADAIDLTVKPYYYAEDGETKVYLTQQTSTASTLTGYYIPVVK